MPVSQRLDGRSPLSGAHNAFIAGTVLASASLGCAPGDRASDSASLRVERSTGEDGVAVVSNLGGSRWGRPATLQEELSIGVLEGDDPYMFGAIDAIWANPERIWVVDRQAPAIRMYDHAGVHLGDLGGQGQGPGEYERPGDFVVRRDGAALLRETPARFTLYGSEGDVVRTWTVAGGGLLSGMFALANDTVLVRRADPPTEAQRRAGMVVTDDDGVAQLNDDGTLGPTRYPPTFDHVDHVIALTVTVGAGTRMSAVNPAVLFFPSRIWTVSPDGSVIAGVSDRYRFEIHHPDGEVTRVERYWDPVPVNPAHIDYLLARLTVLFRQLDPEWSYGGTPPPTTKSAFESLIADRDNRIWVERLGNSYRIDDCADDPAADLRDAFRRPCWGNRTIVDVFSPEGEYLGEVRRPENLSFRATFAQGDMYLAAVEDDAGLVMVKKFRIAAPESR